MAQKIQKIFYFFFFFVIDVHLYLKYILKYAFSFFVSVQLQLAFKRLLNAINLKSVLMLIIFISYFFTGKFPRFTYECTQNKCTFFFKMLHFSILTNPDIQILDSF